MPIADKKKAQTLINLCADEAERLQLSATRLQAYRAAYQGQRVDPVGTPLDGNVTAVSAWIDDIAAVAGSAVSTAMLAARVPTHRNNALEV